MKKRNGKNSPSDLPAIPPSSLFRDRSSVSRHSGHFLLPTMPSRTSTIQSIYSSQQVTFAESPSTSSNHKIPFFYLICAVKYIPYYDIVLSLEPVLEQSCTTLCNSLPSLVQNCQFRANTIAEITSFMRSAQITAWCINASFRHILLHNCQFSASQLPNLLV